MIVGYENLIDEIDQKLINSGIKPDEILLDHVGYKASSPSDYQDKKLLASKDATLIHENEVNRRMVAIFKFETPLVYKQHQILGFEIVAPQPEETCSSYWEHVEYIPSVSLTEFVQNHPDINFDQSALNRPEFAKVAIRFDDGLSAKFHIETVLAEVAKM